MLIDWFTVIAQIVNFLILLLLLKRFLFKPILKAIEERENKIKSQIEDAETKVQEAEEAKKDFQEKNQAIEEKRKSLLEEAKEDAQEKRKTLLENARKDAEELRIQLEESIKEKQGNLSREITERTQQEVMAIARKVMTDLATADLEEQIALLFIRRLKQLKGEEKERLSELLSGLSEDILVKSAFELPVKKQRAIEEAVAEIAGDPLPCQFEIAPDKISGIELTVQGYKISWSIADYLSSLERKLEELLDEEIALSSTSKTVPNELTA